MFSSSSNSTATTVASSTTAMTGSQHLHPKKLFLVISPFTVASDLKQLMVQFGPVKNVYIPQTNEGKSRGIAFVTFVWHEHAASALEQLEGTGLDHVILHPEWAKRTTKPSSSAPVAGGNSKKVPQRRKNNRGEKRNTGFAKDSKLRAAAPSWKPGMGFHAVGGDDGCV